MQHKRSGTAASEVTDAVVAASRALVAVAARSLAAAPGDVTLAQYRALVVLAIRGPQRTTDLARELAIVPSSATRLCDRLVAKALVRRHEGADSRREVEIEITQTGRELVDVVTAQRRGEIERLVQEVPAVHWPALVDGLRIFALAAGEVPEQAWSVGWA